MPKIHIYHKIEAVFGLVIKMSNAAAALESLFESSTDEMSSAEVLSDAADEYPVPPSTSTKICGCFAVEDSMYAINAAFLSELTSVEDSSASTDDDAHAADTDSDAADGADDTDTADDVDAADDASDSATDEDSADDDIPKGETRNFELSEDPLAAVAVNDQYRRADVGDGESSDLWWIEAVATVFPRVYDYPAPTFAPPHWRPAVPAAWNQAAYDEAFALEFPEIAAIGPIENVVIAGGAAAYPLTRGPRPSDVDIFFVGIKVEAKLWRKADEVLSALALECAVAADGDQAVMMVQSMSPGLITVTVYRDDSGKPSLKVQLILRAYESISALLHAFDVPAACVAYDWRHAYTTTLGAYAGVYRANIVVPAYRSTTYEARLAKYFARGFALVLPHMDPARFKKATTLELPWLRFSVVAARGNLATGTIEPLHVAADSDYDTAPLRRGFRRLAYRMANRARYSPIYEGLAALARDGVPGMFRVPIARIHSHNTDEHELRRRSLPLRAFAVRGGPTLAQLLPKAKMADVLDRCQAADVRRGLNVHTLRKTFGLSFEQVGELAAATAQAIAANPGCQISIAAALAPFRLALEAKWQERADAPIEWWIRTDPGRQYTASLNPRIEDPAAWYGSAYAPHRSDEPAPADHVAALRARLEGEQMTASPGYHDGMCAICLDSCLPGPNYVMLACGHAFHWSAAKPGGCEGLFGLLRTSEDENSNCPTCRADFRHDSTVAQPVPVQVPMGAAFAPANSHQSDSRQSNSRQSDSHQSDSHQSGALAEASAGATTI